MPDEMNNGMIRESTSRSQQWTIRNQLEFARGFSGEDHYINAYFGQEVSSSKGYGFTSMIPEWSDVYGVATYPDLTGWTLKSAFKNSLSSLGSHSETQDRSVSLFMTGVIKTATCFKEVPVWTGWILSGRRIVSLRFGM